MIIVKCLRPCLNVLSSTKFIWLVMIGQFNSTTLVIQINNVLPFTFHPLQTANYLRDITWLLTHKTHFCHSKQLIHKNGLTQTAIVTLEMFVQIAKENEMI